MRFADLDMRAESQTGLVVKFVHGRCGEVVSPCWDSWIIAGYLTDRLSQRSPL